MINRILEALNNCLTSDVYFSLEMNFSTRDDIGSFHTVIRSFM